MLFPETGWLYYSGVALIAAMLVFEQSLVPSLVAERGHRVNWRIELAAAIGRPPPFDVLLAVLLP